MKQIIRKSPYGFLYVHNIQNCVKSAIIDIEDDIESDGGKLLSILHQYEEQYKASKEDILPAIKSAFQMGVYPSWYTPEEVVWWFDCARDAMSGMFKQLSGRNNLDGGFLGMALGVIIGKKLRTLPGVDQAWRKFITDTPDSPPIDAVRDADLTEEDLMFIKNNVTKEVAIETGLFKGPGHVKEFLNSSLFCSGCTRKNH